MWKKGEMPEYERQVQPGVGTSPESAAYVPPRPTGQAVIGRSITIKGEVTGDEDLVIQGRVEGSVDLQQHAVTVGPEGQVKANISGKVVIVEGRVEGNVTGQEQVILRKASRVTGDIKAPRVALEDGAHFRGGVLMGEDATHRGAPTLHKAPTPEPVKAPTHAPQPAVAQATVTHQPEPVAPRNPMPKPVGAKG